MKEIKMKKEKEPLFTEMHFNDALFAKDTKEKCERKLQRCKIGLIIAAVAQVAWVLIFAISHMPKVLDDILVFIALVGTVAAYIIGGGLLAAFKGTLKIAKVIGIFGWLCVPFPADIITGLFCSAMAIAMIPLSFIFIPLLLVLYHYIQINKDYKAAEEYLKYCS